MITVNRREHIPSPRELQLYLQNSGWKYSGQERKYDVFSKTGDEGLPVNLYACLNDAYADYARRFEDTLRDLELLEKRLSSLILQDIKRISLPYIGVTDVISSDQILRLVEAFRGSGRKLQAGVMISYKTLNNLPTKWQGIWPEKHTIKDIFVADPYVLNTLHYADYEGVEVLRSLIEATAHGGPNMDALQLDMIWPDVRDIKAYKTAFPHIKLILQVGPKAIAEIDTPGTLVERLREYPIEYALLDSSGGLGIELSTSKFEPYVDALSLALPALNIVVAGGLDSHSASMLSGLFKKYPNLSTDAQGKLRPSGNSMDPLHENMAQEYVTAVLRSIHAS